MFDVLGPGLIGPYFLLEFAVLMYVLLTLRPGFPYLRVITFLAVFYVVYFNFGVGTMIGHQLVEVLWQFIGQRIAGLF